MKWGNGWSRCSIYFVQDCSSETMELLGNKSEQKKRLLRCACHLSSHLLKNCQIDSIEFPSSFIPSDPPVLLGTVKPEYRVQEGETVKLWCKFSGIHDSADNRTLTAWQNPNGHIIIDQYKRFKMRLGRYLKIRRVKLTDQGTYVCIAYNHFGKVKEEIQLVVEGWKSNLDHSRQSTKVI